MADENVCQQFQPHAWKKDLCVKCLKARSVHKLVQQVPVPVKRKSKTGNDPGGTRKDKESSPNAATSGKSMVESASDVAIKDAGSHKDKPAVAASCSKQVADGSKNSDRKKHVPAACTKKIASGNVEKDGGKKQTASGQHKPAVAIKPKPAVTQTKQMQERTQAEVGDPSKASRAEDKDRHPVPQPKSVIVEGSRLDAVSASSGPAAGGPGAKLKARGGASMRPPGAPPEVPGHGGVQAENKADASKTNGMPTNRTQVKGQPLENTNGDQSRHQEPKEAKIPSTGVSSAKKDKNVEIGSNGQVATSGGVSSATGDVKDATAGGGHYYHKYDVTASLQRKMSKPVVKRMADVKEDLQMKTKKTLVMPYTVVDVTSVRRECEDSHPPRLPSTPPPEHPASEPTSRESTLKGARHGTERADAESGNGSQTSVRSEPLPSPKLPIILQEEAQKMREEARTPPPHRMVPIIIRPQHSDNSDTYEPVEDCHHSDEPPRPESKNEAESMVGLTSDADFADYSTTDVGCLSFGRHSKSRASSSKSNAFEAKMAALANLDLLKGITSKVQASEVSADQASADVETGLQPNIPAEHPEGQKTTKKGGRSFFKKLLKIGSKEGGSSGRERGEDDPEGSELGTVQQSDVMTQSAYEDHSGTTSVHSAQCGSPTKQEKLMLSEVQKVLAQRQFSAPDICRELTNLKNVEQQAAEVAPSTTTRMLELAGHQVPAGRSKKKLNTSVVPVSSPQQEEKINNIKQAQEMALSLGIDKTCSRHKADDADGSVDQPSDKNLDQHREEAYGSRDRIQAGVQTCEGSAYSSSSAMPAISSSQSVRPGLVTSKPNILPKVKKTSESSEAGEKVTTNLAPSVVVPELITEQREYWTNVNLDRLKADPLVSPTSSESSSVGYAPDSGATSPQLTSPTSEVPPGGRGKKFKARVDMKTGKIARSMMPAPPPPPPLTPPSVAVYSGSQPAEGGCQTSEPGSPSAIGGGGSPEHRTAGRRTGALTHTDISAPILTSPDLMSRSFSTPSSELASDKQLDQEQLDYVKTHTRNKTITEGIVIDVSTASAEDGEPDFSSLGRMSSRFLNRALPPTPGQPQERKATAKPNNLDSKTESVSIIEENEYEMVSLDSDADDKDERKQPTERPAYEDIDDVDGNEEGLYSSPADLDDASSDKVSEADPEQGITDDGYLEPVSTGNDDEMPVNKRQLLSGSRLSDPDLCLAVYTNTDTSVYGQTPVRTIREAFFKMSAHNVDALSQKARRILSQLVPEPVFVSDNLRWSDFVLKSNSPVYQVADVAIFEAKSNKVDPHSCYIMISHFNVSRTFTESASCGSITPLKVFRDKVSRDFLIDQSKSDHNQVSSYVESDVMVLGYNKLESLDTAIDKLSCLFVTDLNEYEGLVCFWITHIIGAVLDVSTKWPHLQTVPCDNIAAVSVPSCEQLFPVLVVPELIREQPSIQDKCQAMPQCNWNQIGSDIIRILFKLLRLVYKEKMKDPAARIPIRSKYSAGLRALVAEILKDRNSSNGIVLGKFIIEVMLWGPCTEDMNRLIVAEDQEESFHIWLELKRNLVINTLAMGYHRNTLDFANMLSFLCSVTPKLLMDSTKLLNNVD